MSNPSRRFEAQMTSFGFYYGKPTKMRPPRHPEFYPFGPDDDGPEPQSAPPPDVKFYFRIREPQSGETAECMWDNDAVLALRNTERTAFDQMKDATWHSFVSNMPRTLDEFNGIRCKARGKTDYATTNKEIQERMQKGTQVENPNKLWLWLYLTASFADGGAAYIDMHFQANTTIDFTIDDQGVLSVLRTSAR